MLLYVYDLRLGIGEPARELFPVEDPFYSSAFFSCLQFFV